jgi:Transposase DDE domain group 1
MPTECNRDSFDFGTVERRQVVGAFDGGAITSDAGALLLGQTDKANVLVSRLAACFQDARCPALTVHKLPALLSQRIFGIALGYEDIVDHDQLRHDPVLGVLGVTLTRSARTAQPSPASRHSIDWSTRPRSVLIRITRAPTIPPPSRGCS